MIYPAGPLLRRYWDAIIPLVVHETPESHCWRHRRYDWALAYFFITMFGIDNDRLLRYKMSEIDKKNIQNKRINI